MGPIDANLVVVQKSERSMDAGTSAKREKKTEFAGAGCLLQLIGIIAPFAFGALLGTTGAVIGLVVLIALFIYGSTKAIKWRCGSCKNPLDSKSVTICPVCKAHLR